MKTSRIILILAIVIIAVITGLYLFGQRVIAPAVDGSLTEAQARMIAEKICIKGGEALGGGSYNENSKTWWFDANLNATQEGCNPACVVNTETKKAEINWRCTGLIVPSAGAEAIKALFVAKYPKYADTVTVQVIIETADHARGSVSFVSGQPGGLFLASKVNNVWQLDFDGNGQIPCNLSAKGYPTDMLTDCAK